MAADDDSSRLVGIADLSRRLAAAFERLGLTPQDSTDLVELPVASELRGHPDHGVAALGILSALSRDGVLNPARR
jgi:LDH2 family malate/lactate/ureidoglycolate dehydrogenase